MKKQIIILMPFLLVGFFLGCSQKKPYHHPKHPNYEIRKPTVKYAPSRKNLAKMVEKLQGSPYVWAEEGPNNFDCSGFTYYMYGSMGIDIPRVARDQAKKGKRVTLSNLEYGDLIFFATNKHNSRKITHVGMYLGDGWFTHASTVTHEVVYSNLFTSNYYKRKLRMCRRYLPDNGSIRVAPNTPKKPWEKKTVPLVKTVKKETAKTEKITERSKAIVIKAPLKEIEQSSPKGNFYVQAGSFIGKPESSLIQNIKDHGFVYKTIQFPKDGKSISKILIGPYKTREQAMTTLTKVKDEIEKDAFIAEIR